jgi:hypothetical protein
MGRRLLWLLWLPLAAGGWLIAHWLMHAVVATEHHEGEMVSEAAHHSVGTVHMCAACATMLLLFVALLLARPALVLGYELGQRLVARLAPRPPAWTIAPQLPAWLEPQLARPSILATGHGERAPPGIAFVHA